MRGTRALWRAKRRGIGRENVLKSLLTFIPFAHSLPSFPLASPFCAPYRRTYLSTVEMTPDGTCFTHDARIDGIGKKRARDYTGGLKSAASVNREFYHGRVLSLENCPTNLIATRESRYSREHTRARVREQTGKMSACEKIVSRLFPLQIFSIESLDRKSSGTERENRAIRIISFAKSKKYNFLFYAVLFFFCTLQLSLRCSIS